MPTAKKNLPEGLKLTKDWRFDIEMFKTTEPVDDLLDYILLSSYEGLQPADILDPGAPYVIYRYYLPDTDGACAYCWMSPPPTISDDNPGKTIVRRGAA